MRRGGGFSHIRIVCSARDWKAAGPDRDPAVPPSLTLRSSFPMRIVLTALLATVLAASAAAQTSYYADLDGTQETPPTGSAAGGWAHVTLNPGNTLTYEVRTWGVVG